MKVTTNVVEFPPDTPPYVTIKLSVAEAIELHDWLDVVAIKGELADELFAQLNEQNLAR